MSQLEKRAIPLIFTISAIAYVMSIVMRDDAFGRHWFIREDGVIESATALALLAGAILCGYRCWKLRNQRPKAFLLCMAAWGAILLFGMGEEISWGQRIFSIESPEFFLEHNAQNETNLHNLVVADTSINKLIFGKVLAVAVVLYLLLPVFYRQSRPARQLLNRCAVPVPRLHQIIAIVAIAILVETSSAKKRGEITEFAFSSLGLLVLINPRNRSIFRVGLASSGHDASQANTSAPVLLPCGPSESSDSERPVAQPRRRAA